MSGGVSRGGIWESQAGEAWDIPCDEFEKSEGRFLNVERVEQR